MPEEKPKPKSPLDDITEDQAAKVVKLLAYVAASLILLERGWTPKDAPVGAMEFAQALDKIGKEAD